MKNAKERKEDNRTLYTYKDSSISIYFNASFEYSNGKMGENKIDITDDEAKRIATDFLVNNNLLPDGFAFSGMGRDILQEGDNDEIEVSKIVYFSRYIDGSIVDGTSQVYVTLINNGEISYVYSSYMVEMKKNKIRSTNNIDIMENLETIINDDNYIDIDESADSIEISNIDVGYWEDSSPFSEENYMQPVYKLTGSEYSDGKKIGKFEIITQALQE